MNRDAKTLFLGLSWEELLIKSGSIKLTAKTKIIDGGRAGIVPQTKFLVTVQDIPLGEFHNLEEATVFYMEKTNGNGN